MPWIFKCQKEVSQHFFQCTIYVFVLLAFASALIMRLMYIEISMFFFGLFYNLGGNGDVTFTFEDGAVETG